MAGASAEGRRGAAEGPDVQATGISTKCKTGRSRQADTAVRLASKDRVPQGCFGEFTEDPAGKEEGGGERGATTILSLKKRKSCAGTRDVGDNCGEHNCRHSQVHIPAASTDMNTQGAGHQDQGR